MTTWRYEGLQEQDALEDAPWVMQYIGNLEDKANLKTNCELTDATGRPIQPVLVRPDIEDADGYPVWTWTDIPDDCTINWQAKTLTCDDEAGSDRVEISMMTLDYVLLAQLANDILADWPVEDIEGLLAEIEAGQSEGPYETMMMDALEAKIDASAELGNLILPTIYSDVVQTDAAGLAEGQIPIPDFWPRSQYFLNFHYGYSARSEASESAKFWQFLKEWGITLLALIVVLVIMVVFVATGGAISLAVPALLTSAAFAADLALLAHDFMATGFGIIDENFEGCLFPLYGFNHTYAFAFPVEEVRDDAANNINPTLSTEQVDAVETWLTESDFWAKIVSVGALLGIALVGLRSGI